MVKRVPHSTEVLLAPSSPLVDVEMPPLTCKRPSGLNVVVELIAPIQFSDSRHGLELFFCFPIDPSSLASMLASTPFTPLLIPIWWLRHFSIMSRPATRNEIVLLAA